MKMTKSNSGGLGHSAVLRTSPLSGSLNRRVCGSLRSPKLPYRATSHTRQPLATIKLKKEIEDGEKKY